MNPNIWGPAAWIFLHSVTLNYPDYPDIQDRKIMYEFFHSVADILPCSTCKEDFTYYMRENPINFNLDSKFKLTKWLVDIHNKINVKNKKSTITMKEFEKIYSQLYKHADKPYKTVIFYKKRYYQFFTIIIILSIILFFIIFYFVNKRIKLL